MSSFGNAYEMQRRIEENVKEEIVKVAVIKYLKENLDKIMGQIDEKQILNMIVLKTAQRVVNP